MIETLLINSGAILGIIIGVAGFIGLAAFLIYRLLHPKMKGLNEKPSEEQILNEEMDRLLKPVDDEEVAKQINNYKDEEDK